MSELVPYKRIEHAVQCFSRTGRPLKIVGDGPEYKRLRKVWERTSSFADGSRPLSSAISMRAAALWYNPAKKTSALWPLKRSPAANPS